MLSPRLLLALLPLGALMLIGCGGGNEGPTNVDRPLTTTAVETPVRIYRESDTTIRIPVSERFAIVLPAPRAKGYRWRIRTRANPAIVGTPTRTYRAGSDISRYRGLASGTTTLVMDYVAARATTPARSVKFRIRVG